MDTPPVPLRTGSIIDNGTAEVLTMLMSDKSTACIGMPASETAEAAALMRSADGYQPVAGQLADILEESVLGDRCLLNTALSDAAWLLLTEISETAVPDAVRAGALAAAFKAHQAAAP
jgi:hypothetical protein